MRSFATTILIAYCALVLFVDHAAAAPKTLLLLGQKPDGHPPGTHEYLPGQRIIAKLLSSVPDLKIEIESADEPWNAGPDKIRQADGVVLFLSEGGRWASSEPRRLDALMQLAAKGGGFVGIHWGIGCKPVEPIEAYLKLVGGCHGGPDRKFQVVDAEVRAADAQHPIAQGLAPFSIHEEFYYKLKLNPASTLKPLLQAQIDGNWETVSWTWERAGGGRSFGFTGLHFHDNWQRPEYRRLIAQGVLWTLSLPVPAAGLKLDLSPDDLKP